VKHLYHQLYLTIIASLVLVVLVAGLLWRLGPSDTPASRAFEIAGELMAAQLPPASAGAMAQQQAITRLHDRLDIDLGLFDSARRPLATAGRPVPTPPARQSHGWIYGHDGAAWAIKLPDSRWIVARPSLPPHRPVLRLIVFLGGIALAVALCAYPVVRRLTRRLERLQQGVEQLGSGDLSARVEVEGRDEVARLAASFNRAAGRIEELVRAHKLLLANTSHELRTPLSRIRIGVELMLESIHGRGKTELLRDIAELDRLIDEILLSSRLDAQAVNRADEEIDLLALAAEEGARYDDCTLEGQSVTVFGDRGLLQRMLRNLLDNAQRYGRVPIEISVGLRDGLASIAVSDQGPGVPESERELIFSPFYRGGSGRESGRGTGLGLTLVHQIASNHGGTARWAPGRDKPSRIEVTLPLAENRVTSRKD
jgi:two-component system, OmpR family, sensor histidine kinase RstB